MPKINKKELLSKYEQEIAAEMAQLPNDHANANITIYRKLTTNISKELLKIDHRERLVADFIAGMTDRFAINLYNKIK